MEEHCTQVTLSLPVACAYPPCHLVSLHAQVIQLPVVKNRVKKLLQGAVKKLALLGGAVIPSSDDSLEDFLHATGRFFGKDPQKWEPFGEWKGRMDWRKGVG